MSVQRSDFFRPPRACARSNGTVAERASALKRVRQTIVTALVKLLADAKIDDDSADHQEDEEEEATRAGQHHRVNVVGNQNGGRQ